MAHGHARCQAAEAAASGVEERGATAIGAGTAVGAARSAAAVLAAASPVAAEAAGAGAWPHRRRRQAAGRAAEAWAAADRRHARPAQADTGGGAPAARRLPGTL